MAKGTVAKEYIASKLKEVFGEDYIGEVDKKIYVWCNDGGAEKVQIAISMTCPKNYVEAANAPAPVSNDSGFTDWTSAPTEPIMVTQEEEDNIRNLLAKLGL